MDKNFSVDVGSFQKISKIESAWGEDDYKALLSLMEIDDGFDNMTPDEIKEMCFMSLTDFEPEEAARFVLTYLFEGQISKGKIEQLSHQMPEDSMWEEYPDPFFHKRLFDAHGLLRAAFNGVFAKPTGVQFIVRITSQHQEALRMFQKKPHAPLVRLLSRGLSDGDILNRLYGEQIAGNTFTEAKGILWDLKEVEHTDYEVRYSVTSSELWFGELDDVGQFEAQTHADSSEKTERD